MARIYDPPPEQLAEWEAWCATRPPVVRAATEKLNPWSLYRIKTTGDRVTIYSLSEDAKTGQVTASVNVTGQFNKVAFDRQVFGVSLDDLEPCELPDPKEELGTLLTDEAEIDAFIDAIRPFVLANRKPKQ